MRKKPIRKDSVSSAPPVLSKPGSELVLEQLSLYMSGLLVPLQEAKQESGCYLKQPQDWTDIFIEWCRDLVEFTKDREYGGRYLDTDSYIYHSPIDSFWSSHDPFSNLPQLAWRIKFSSKALSKLTNLTEMRVKVMRSILDFSLGNIKPGSNCNLAKSGPCPNMIGFYSAISKSEFLVMMILVDRVPLVERDRVVAYEYRQYLQVIDIVTKEGMVLDSIEKFQDEIMEDSDRWITSDLSELRGAGMTNSFEHSVFIASDGKVLPKQLGTRNLPLRESEMLKFNEERQRWISPEDKLLNRSKLDKVTQHKLALLIQQLSNKKTLNSLVSFIKKNKSLEITLSPQEEEVISAEGNLLVVGRSGTGKTTCEVLRLFATDMVYKRAYIKQTARERLNFTPDDVDLETNLHLVFTTVNHVLVNEVFKFHRKFKQKLKIQLGGSVPESQDENENKNELNEYSAISTITFQNIRDGQFPLFLSITHLIILVDSTLKSPFYARTPDGKLQTIIDESSYHNRNRKLVAINQDFKKHRSTIFGLEPKIKEESQHHEEITHLHPRASNIPQAHSAMSFEIDYNSFLINFYPRRGYHIKISPVVIWTEFMSYIKGSARSYLYPGFYLPLPEYLAIGRKNSLLDEDTRRKIWEYYHEYEKWKISLNAYDAQDVVNYMLDQIKKYKYQGPAIHMLLIDEVQDLTPAYLLLLLQVTTNNIIMAGDTAQTIAKGVGFRFIDLLKIFKKKTHNSDIAFPNMYQLTINFRSHQKILNLANAIVKILKTLFPHSIDVLNPETSKRDGEMPMVLESGDPKHLGFLFSGKDIMLNSPVFLSHNIQFGADQAMIIRANRNRASIPIWLRSILSFTVLESKGLEFKDVIIYNFFTDSEIELKDWRILLGLKLEGEDIILEKNIDTKKYALLCTELKQLYVAITRTRERLIIYDEDLEKREFIIELWNRLSVVNMVKYYEDEKGAYMIGSNGSIINSLASESGSVDWLEQGYRMMRHKLYEQAEYCFNKANDPELASEAKAYGIAEKAKELMCENQALLESSKREEEKLGKGKKKELKIRIKEAETMFKEAAEIFRQLGLLDETAKCLASAKEHQSAAEIFEVIGKNEAAALNYEQCEMYLKAANLFDQAGNFEKAIINYSKVQEYEPILKCIYKNLNNYDETVLRKYEKYYIPKALSKLIDSPHHKTYGSRACLMNLFKYNSKFDIKSEKIFAHLDDINMHDKWLKDDIYDPIEFIYDTMQLSKPLGYIIPSSIKVKNPHPQYTQLTNESILIDKCTFDKILQYITMISKEIQSYLEVIQRKYNISFEVDLEVPYHWQLVEMIEYEMLDVSIIDSMLHHLFYMKQYDLCVRICNIYCSANLFGNILVSFAQNYSNIHVFDGSKILAKNFETLQYTRAIIASKAIYNILESLSPEYLKNEFNSKLDFFQGFLILGFWKSILFLIDIEDGLAVAETFADFNNYKILYSMKRGKKFDPHHVFENNFKWLESREIKSEDQLNAAIIGIDSVIWKLRNIFETRSANLKEKFEMSDISLYLPDYLKYTKILSYVVNNEDYNDQNLGWELNEAFSFINCIYEEGHIKNASNIKVRDIFSFVTQVIIFPYLQRLKQTLVILEPVKFENFLLAVGKIINILTGKSVKTFNPFYEDMLYGILSPFGVRKIRQSKLTSIYPTLSHAMLHKSSIIFKKLLELNYDDFVVADIEANFILVKIQHLNSLAAKLILDQIKQLVDYRTNRLLDTRVQQGFIREILVGLDYCDLYVAGIYLLASNYGERFFLNKLNLNVDPKANSEFDSKSINNHKSTLEDKKKMQLLQAEMEKLTYERSIISREDEDLEIDDPNDPNSIEFRIIKIRKKMFEINARSHNRMKDVNHQLVKLVSEWMINEGKAPCKITSISRGALIQYIYDVFESTKLHLTKIPSMLVKCHRISVLCERENLYMQLLRENTFIATNSSEHDSKLAPHNDYSNKTYLNQLHYVDMMEHCHNQDWRKMCISANRYFTTSIQGLAFKESMILICNCLFLFLSGMISHEGFIRVPYLIHDLIFYRNSSIQSFSSTKKGSKSDWIILSEMLNHFIYLIEYIYKAQSYSDRSHSINLIEEVYFTLLVNHPKHEELQLTEYINQLKRICNVLIKYNFKRIYSSCRKYINLPNYKKYTLEEFIRKQLRFYNFQLISVRIIIPKPIDQKHLDTIRIGKARIQGAEMLAARFINIYLPRYRKEVFDKLIKGHSRFIFLTEMCKMAQADNFKYTTKSKFIMIQWEKWRVYIKKLDSFTEILSRLYRSRYSAKFKDIDLVKILPKIREITDLISDFIVTILNCTNEIELNEERVRIDKLLGNIKMSEFNHKLKKEKISYKGEWKQNWERFIRSIKPVN